MTAYRHIGLVVACLLAGTPAGALAAGNPAKGEKLFKKKVGPSLHGVIGRAAGTADGFRYSKAMTAYGQSGVVWGEDTLNVYLEAPRKVVKGTKMSFPGLKKAQDRADVIAYLKQVSE
jgi:cytochrome c